MSYLTQSIFCPKKGGNISITLDKEERSYSIVVKDNGTGIQKDKLDKIFVRFYQVDTSNTREHKGTGLGLSICKGIVEGHGGKIWAESKGMGQGTEIHILLPV
ncbi:ATP-binding protein [Candidatus Nitrosotalea sp. TS]|uniref:ATP-binding protein n=1 Tax=Candidatus Nitrosotalea sp. TS TaxID=2341020 RepID=UPI00140AF1FA|nr:ATP-binding protein [Candidatus Nitrosotalea sp. TS]